jgi:hypothetical protein
MDLDQLIHEADPARGLEIDIPEARRHLGRQARRNWASLVTVAFSVATAIGVAAVALSIGGHSSGGPMTIPPRLPFSSPAPPTAAASAVPGSARLVQTFPDPVSGPDWGMRTYRTRNGMTCVQVGRIESGVIGAIGAYGAYSNDMRFHPFALGRGVGLGDCAPNDARGHAFINISAVNTAASAAEQPCLQHDVALPREHCAASSLRDVYFGLLGPDATSITYAGTDGRPVTERTRGSDGAYLVVRPLAHGSCARRLMRQVGAPSSCNYDSQGFGLGPTLRSGEITRVSYRDGHVCRLPAPHGVIVRLAQCPVVGYVASPGPRYTATEIAAPVTIRKLPARYYCEHSGVYRPAVLAIPCDGAVPRGYRRVEFTPSRNGHGYDPGANLLVYVSWIARGAVKNTESSSYSVSINYPKGCGAGGEGTGTHTRIRAGQHLTRYFYVPTKCRGTYTGRVTYIPNLGPGGEQSGPLPTVTSTSNGVFLVGGFHFTIP